jgi:hypothetical protein
MKTFQAGWASMTAQPWNPAKVSVFALAAIDLFV